MLSAQGAWSAFFLLLATCWARHRFSRRMRPVPADGLCAARWLVVGLTLKSPFFYATLVLAVVFSLREPRERLRLECLFLPVYLAAHLGEWPGILLAFVSAVILRGLLGHLATPPRGWLAPFEARPWLRSCCRIATGTLVLGLPLLGNAGPPWQYALALFVFGVGGSPWRRREKLVIVENTPREAAAVISMLGSRARDRLREHLSAAHKQVLLEAQPDYLTASEQAGLRRRFLALGPVLSCATVLDDCPLPELANWLRCWPQEIARSYFAMLSEDTRQAVQRELSVPEPPPPPTPMRRARRKIYACGHCDEVFVDEWSLSRHELMHDRPTREGCVEGMVIRHPDAPRLTLDEMVELWPAWFAGQLQERCLRGVRPPAPRQRRPLPRQLPWVAAAGLGLAAGLGWPQAAPARTDVLGAFGGRVLEGPAGSVVLVPPGVEPEPVRWLVGGNVQVFPLAPAPALPWWPVPVALLGLGMLVWPRSRPPAPATENCCTRRVPRESPPPRMEVLLAVDPLEVQVGRGLLGIVDPNQGNRMGQFVTDLRRRLAQEKGVAVPGVRFRDNLKLEPNEYVLRLREVEVGRGTVQVNQQLAIGGTATMDGMEGKDHLTGHTGCWLTPGRDQEAREAGARLLPVHEVVGRHLEAVVLQHLADLITMQEADRLLEMTAREHPAVVAEARERLELHDLAAFLRQFLRLRGSLRDLAVILEVMCRERSWEKDPALLAERCARLYSGSN